MSKKRKDCWEPFCPYTDKQITPTDFLAVCPIDEYCVLQKSDPFIQSLISPNLLEKCRDEIVVMCSGDPYRRVYFGVVYHRIDDADNSIDKDTYIVGFSDADPPVSGMSLYHGEHKGRVQESNMTTKSPDSNSVIKYMPLYNFPTKPSGKLEELHPSPYPLGFNTASIYYDIKYYGDTEPNSD